MDTTAQNTAELFIQYLNEENFNKAGAALILILNLQEYWEKEKAHRFISKDMRQMKFKYEKTFTSS